MVITIKINRWGFKRNKTRNKEEEAISSLTKSRCMACSLQQTCTVTYSVMGLLTHGSSTPRSSYNWDKLDPSDYLQQKQRKGKQTGVKRVSLKVWMEPQPGSFWKTVVNDGGLQAWWNRASNLPSLENGSQAEPQGGALKACGLLPMWGPSNQLVVGGRQGKGHTDS